MRDTRFVAAVTVRTKHTDNRADADI